MDARTRRLLDERTALIGAGDTAPKREFGDARAERSPFEVSKTPPTVNPPASELRFDVADEARDVAARLDAYAKRAERGPAGTEPLKLSLAEAFRIAQRSSSEYLRAEEEYIFAAIRLLIERHLWGPRLFNDTSVTVAGQGDEGDFRSAVAVINDLRVTKRLPYGGEVEAAWVWRATEQLRETVGGRYRQSSELVFSGNVPLLRGAGLVAQESLIQAERDLIYRARDFESFRRAFLVSIAADYFDLLQSQAQIANERQRLASLARIAEAQRAKFEAGRIAAFHANIAANDVLEATASLAGQMEGYILQLERFKIRLGLDPSVPVELDPGTLTVPEPEVSLDQATEYALTYRLDLQNRRDQLDDARRAVANARNRLLPDLNLNGSVGIPTDPDAREGGLAFQGEELSYQAGVTFGLPLDRETERLSLRQAIIALEQNRREYERFRDEVAVGVRQAVRNIDLARFQLRLAEERVRVNEQRVEELRLKSDEVDTQTQVDAANNLQQSRNALDQARTALRNAVLNYLRDSGQLRVRRDGTFEPLPGMEGTPREELPAGS